MTSSSIQSFTVLTDEDGVPGSIFEREPEEYTVETAVEVQGIKIERQTQ